MQQLNQKSELDAALVNTVVKATQDVLSTMAATEAKLKNVWAEEAYHASGDVSAMIGISGEKGEGMFALSFPLELASILVARLLGSSPGLLSSEDRSDGVGELINMISGQTKAALANASQSVYKLSLPTVILGKDHQISSGPKNAPFLNMCFECENHTFNLQIVFKTNA